MLQQLPCANLLVNRCITAAVMQLAILIVWHRITCHKTLTVLEVYHRSSGCEVVLDPASRCDVRTRLQSYDQIYLLHSPLMVIFHLTDCMLVWLQGAHWPFKEKGLMLQPLNCVAVDCIINTFVALLTLIVELFFISFNILEWKMENSFLLSIIGCLLFLCPVLSGLI